MDTRDTPEQAELRRAARQLARELSPATVADLDDATRGKRLPEGGRAGGRTAHGARGGAVVGVAPPLTEPALVVGATTTAPVHAVDSAGEGITAAHVLVPDG